MSIGIGLAFAAMPNLIVEAVPPEETGQATGVNTLVRSVGASLGSQVTAAVLAASAVGAGLPTDSGYTEAFLVGSGVALLAGDHRHADPQPQRPHGPAARPRHPGGADRGRPGGPHARRRGPQPRARDRGRRRGVRRERRRPRVPEIAARAGVGKGTVYRCFPTKDHLVAAVAIERAALVRARGPRGGRRPRPVGRVHRRS